MSVGLLRFRGMAIFLVSLACTQCASDPRDDVRWEQSETLYELATEYAAERNLTKAVALFRAAAQKGHPGAQFRLGALYEHGMGVPQHYSKAAHWYGCAARQGHGNAQFRLGIMYAEGNGVCKSDIRAHAWLNVAAAQNNYLAAYDRSRLEQNMRSEDIAKAQQLAAAGDLLHYQLCEGPTDGRACPSD